MSSRKLNFAQPHRNFTLYSGCLNPCAGRSGVRVWHRLCDADAAAPSYTVPVMKADRTHPDYRLLSYACRK
jgi:hypothetical protein